MWQRYYAPQSLDEAIRLLADHRGEARIVAGATDLLLELERGLRPGITTLIDLTRIPGLDNVLVDEEGRVRLGPLVTHNHCAVSPSIVERAYTLARACWEVGAPQIRNRGTIAGNLITASPANDSIPPLMALGARVVLRSTRGERLVPLSGFYTGVRKTVMEDDELLAEIRFPLPPENARSTFVKLALRRAQAISIVSVAVLLEMDGEVVEKAAITLGAVAPAVIHAPEAEAHLLGKVLTPETIERVGELAAEASRPIDDLRGSAAYRREMVRVCTIRGLRTLAAGREREGFPAKPVTLWGPGEWHLERKLSESLFHHQGVPIETVINGRRHTFASGHEKTLLRLLREEAGLTGTKEGCAEGECGACTVILDGMAVMACMVPAPRAHGAEISTVEGLAVDGKLHPIQQGFVEAGAVQCGYCTPGLLISGAMLLDERHEPGLSEIQQAITGNLCRCTGYFSILSAFERAVALRKTAADRV